MKYSLRSLMIVVAAIAALVLLLVEPSRPPDWRVRLVIILACAGLWFLGDRLNRHRKATP